MIIPLLKNMTIKHKLTAIIMLTSVIALLMGLGAFIIWEYFDTKENMVVNLSAHAAIIEDNSKAALAFENADDAQKILSALRANPSIVHARICVEDGSTFAFYNKDSNDKSIHLLNIKGNGYRFDGNSLNLRRNIILNGKIIGSLYLKANLDELYQGLISTAKISAVTVVIIILLTYLVSLEPQKIISGPILKLTELAKEVSKKRDYSTRATKESNDETGQLIDAFNEMLYEIQKRDLELTQLNEKLEIRVKERTADLVKVNKKLENLNRELAETIEKLTTANIELGDFAHVAAHDLKAPLRAIGSLAGVLVEDYEDRLGEQGKKQLNLLMKRTERMSELINGILRYSEAGRISTEKGMVDLNEVVEETIANIAVPENIEITIENRLPTLICEKIHLLQVFQNLLSNAVKYTDKPRGKIRVACVEDNGFWKFSVSDNGPGIEEKYYDKIFTIFQTLKRRDELENTGIGLTIVKKIIKLYNGEIWVESEVGQGSTFFFTLPKQKKEVKKYAKLQANIAG